MEITYIGHNHVHDMDFEINRPNGSGDYLALVIKSFGLFVCNNSQIIIPPNTFFLYNLNTPQYYKAYNEPFSNDWFHFKLEDYELDFFNNLSIPFETPISLPNMSFFSLLIKNMTYEYYSNNLLSNEILNHYLYLFFLKISETCQLDDPIQKDSHNDKLALLRSKIYAEPYKKWCIPGLAHEITLSPCYFQRLYKKRFGISCVKDIINARIEYAKHMLTQTDLSVKCISQMCGYDNDVHFMRQFKNLTGFTPSEYRSAHYLPSFNS